jgi:hypothetical protein
MNALCNPTGRANAFRPVDWLVERNNLYTKVSMSARDETAMKRERDVSRDAPFEIRLADPSTGHLRREWTKSYHRLHLQAVTSDRGISELSRYRRGGISTHASHPQTHFPGHDGDN